MSHMSMGENLTCWFDFTEFCAFNCAALQDLWRYLPTVRELLAWAGCPMLGTRDPKYTGVALGKGSSRT